MKNSYIKYIFGVISIIISVFLLLRVNNLLPINFFHESTSLYLFSALLQSNAAILSIVGIFVIYKIQSLQSSLDSLKNMLMNDGGRIVWPQTVIEFDSMNATEKEEYLTTRRQDSEIFRYFKAWKQHEDKLFGIKKTIKYPTLIIASGILFNVLGIVFANYSHNNQNNLELITITLSVLLQAYIVCIVVKSIFKILLND